jgi:hypothetical protein
MKKLRQQSGCAARFGNTEVKNRCRKSPLMQNALHRYWKSNFSLSLIYSLSEEHIYLQLHTAAYRELPIES